MAEDEVAGSDNNYDMVFIWSLDTITKLTTSTIDEANWNTREQFPTMSALHCLPGGVLFRTGFENFKDWGNDFRLDHIGDVIRNIHDGSIDVGKTFELNPIYDGLRKFYEKISRRLKRNRQIVSHYLLKQCDWLQFEREICQDALNHQTLYHNVWKESKWCMKMINKRSKELGKKYANVVVCEEGAVYGATQLLVAGLSSEVPIENIYSVQNATRAEVFGKIQNRFGNNCVFISVTSKPETLPFAKEMKMPVWCVDSVNSLKHLYSLQHRYLHEGEIVYLKNLIAFLEARKICVDK